MGGIIGFAGFLIFVTTIVGFLVVTATRHTKPREDVSASRRAVQPWENEGRYLR